MACCLCLTSASVNVIFLQQVAGVQPTFIRIRLAFRLTAGKTKWCLNADNQNLQHLWELPLQDVLIHQGRFSSSGETEGEVLLSLGTQRHAVKAHNDIWPRLVVKLPDTATLTGCSQYMPGLDTWENCFYFWTLHIFLVLAIIWKGSQ